jgi:hypothetical protein
VEYRRFLICNFCVIGNVDPHFICEKNVSWMFTSFFVVWSLYKPLEEVWRTKKTFLEHLLWSISIMVFSFCLLSSEFLKLNKRFEFKLFKENAQRCFFDWSKYTNLKNCDFGQQIAVVKNRWKLLLWFEIQQTVVILTA